MKKIAIFNDFQLPLPPTRGGSVPTLTQLLIDENENRKEFIFDVYSCFDKKAYELSQNYKYTNFYYVREANILRKLTNLLFKLNFRSLVSNVPIPFSVWFKLRKEKYDLIYINGYIRGALSIIKANPSVPCIVHHHVVTDIINEPTILGKEIVEKSSKLCFVSDYATRYAQKGNKSQNSKMMTFPNAIDITRFQKNALAGRTYVRRKYNIKDDDKVVSFVGRLVETKGALELIRAFCKIKNDKIKLLIIGAATYSDYTQSPYINECVELSKNCPNIIFTGYVPYDLIPAYYEASDIGTLLSICEEACGLVGLEFLAAGKPIITTDRGGDSGVYSRSLQDCSA